MKSWFRKFGKKEKQKPKEEFPPPKKEDLDTLIKELNDLQATLDLAGPSESLVYKMGKARLRELEEKTVDLLADDFQKKVFMILMKHEFDLLKLFEQDWKETLRAVYKDIAQYLVGMLGKELPVSGKDFLFWMLEKAKQGNSENRYQNIGEAILKGEVYDYSVCDKETIQQILMFTACIFTSDEYRRQFEVLMEIMCDLEGGEQFIREELCNKIEENFFESDPSLED